MFCKLLTNICQCVKKNRETQTNVMPTAEGQKSYKYVLMFYQYLHLYYYRIKTYSHVISKIFYFKSAH